MNKILSHNPSDQNEIQNDNFFQKIFGRLDPFLLIGILISVIVALILVLLGEDKVQSLIVGLIATTITLVIDLIARLKESEKRVIEANTIGSLLMSDRELFRIINQLVRDYLTVKMGNFELFEQRADDALAECKDTMHRLVNGYMVAEPVGKFSIGRRGIKMARSSIKAVSCEPLELWRSSHWQTGLQANADAIKSGVKITRIFIQDEKSLSEFEDVLKAHCKAGSEVFTVSPQELPPRLIESYFIVDEHILAEFYLTIDGKLKEERISINPVEVDRALDKFNSIFRHAQKYAG